MSAAESANEDCSTGLRIKGLRIKLIAASRHRDYRNGLHPLRVILHRDDALERLSLRIEYGIRSAELLTLYPALATLAGMEKALCSRDTGHRGRQSPAHLRSSPC